MSFFQLSALTIEKTMMEFASLRNKAVCITNVASKWGKTANHYQQMIDLKAEFGDKLTILCFPCNQFGKQEPKGNEEIKKFVDDLGGASLTLMDKVEVNGPNTSPVFTFLKENSGPGGSEDIGWNFKAYWLVDFEGNIKREGGTPKTLRDKIKAILGEPVDAPVSKKSRKTSDKTKKKAQKENTKEVKKVLKEWGGEV